MMDETELLRSMTDEQLVRLYGSWYEEMKKRGIVRTRNIVGDYAVEAYRDNSRLPDLTISPISLKHFDATSHEGWSYNVKTVTGTSTGVFYGLNPPGDGETSEGLFDYLVLVRLYKDYTLDGV